MSRRGKRVRIGKGVYRDPSGLSAVVSVRGDQREHRFPLDTDRDTIKRWQDETRATLRKLHPKHAKDSLSSDIERYYKLYKASADRKRELAKWADALGGMRRDHITASQLAAQLEDWRKTLEWSASTLNHHRTAIMHLYRRLDGKSAACIVRDVPRYQEPDAAPRGYSWPIIRTILRSMPPSPTRLRIALIATTGLPHGILGQLKPEDVDVVRRLYRHPGRKKGKGAKGQLLPLSRRAARYFRLLNQAGAWGPFSRGSLRKSFRLGCEKAGELLDMDLSSMRPYDCRHSFALQVLAATGGNIGAVKTLLSHVKLDTTLRYTRASVNADAAAAISAVDRIMAPTHGTPEKKATEKAAN